MTAVDFGTSPAAHFTVVSNTKITGTTSSGVDADDSRPS